MDIGSIVDRQREFFASGASQDYSFRIEQLQKLKFMLKKYQGDMIQAASEDLGKPRFETFISEIALMFGEVDYALSNLRCWMTPEKAKMPFAFIATQGSIYPEPYGVSLVVSPWNYPFMLVFSPLVGSIAAGNCTILKPSEVSVNSSHLVARMVADTFDPRYVTAIEGGMEVNRPLMAEKSDYIFFTGSSAVGKAWMEAAAKHLTPVTLELGGKSPCIVDNEARIEVAAERIVWGKFLNAGQTCIAPDYLLVQEDIKSELLKRITHYIGSFYGKNPATSRNYGRIINGSHFDRISRLLDSGRVLAGGDMNRDDLYIGPTVIDDISWDSAIMQEEIFGPLLPVISYGALDEAISMVNARPRPLALYFFSTNTAAQDRIVRETSSGGVTINSTLLQYSTQTLPYGGLGNSGMGAYHGKGSFDTFTHYKSVFNQRIPVDFIIRPPYPNLRIFNRVLQRLLLVGRKCR
ncbi:MAG: aldehyde dehydrogenase [Candidatus Solincola sediminis]|uniref:Aldehyde dehydrogenase n=1 Tax=Candidatus Solincola sediminis TaxID=1797199 RepID=A0A1F2WJD7_9ACTN|nr:MAG: aldehyde dehydrogenase [Candidatus Solincola sediminis]